MTRVCPYPSPFVLHSIIRGGTWDVMGSEISSSVPCARDDLADWLDPHHGCVGGHEFIFGGESCGPV